MEIRSVLYILGILISSIGCTMAVPSLIDLIYKNPDWSVFSTTGLIVFVLAYNFNLQNQGEMVEEIRKNIKIQTEIALGKRDLGFFFETNLNSFFCSIIFNFF